MSRNSVSEASDAEQTGLLHGSDRSEEVDHNGIKEVKSIEDAITGIGMGKYQWWIFALFCVGAFFEALVMINLSFFLPVLRDAWSLATWQLALLSTFVHIGMGSGGLIFGRVADIIGRRQILLGSFFVCGGFGFLSALCQEIYTYSVFRMLMGVGYGANAAMQVVLLSELVPVHVRGKLLALVDAAFGLGMVASAGVGWVVIPNLGWRYFAVITSVPPIIWGIVLVYYCPQSPRFLAAKRRTAEARELLVTIAATNGASELLKDKIRDLKLDKDQNVDAKGKSSMKEMFNPLLLRITVLMIFIWSLYATASRLFIWIPLFMKEDPNLRQPGNPMGNVYSSALLISAGEVFGSILIMLLVNPIDRRYILGTGLAFLAACSVALGLSKQAAVVLTLLPFLGLVRKAILLLLHIFTPEYYPTKVRSTALGMFIGFERMLPIGGHWIIAFMYNWSFLGLCLVFAVSFALSSVLSFLLPYDTRDKSLGGQYYEDKQKLEEERRRKGEKVEDDDSDDEPAVLTERKRNTQQEEQ